MDMYLIKAAMTGDYGGPHPGTIDGQRRANTKATDDRSATCQRGSCSRKSANPVLGAHTTYDTWYAERMGSGLVVWVVTAKNSVSTLPSNKSVRPSAKVARCRAME